MEERDLVRLMDLLREFREECERREVVEGNGGKGVSVVVRVMELVEFVGMVDGMVEEE